MTRYRKVQHQVPADGLLFLKPEKLGRYYHKVPVYIKKLAGKYPRAISDYFLSHYRINSDLREVIVLEARHPAPQCRYNTAIGKIGFSIDRPLLSELLESYYGGSARPAQDEPPISSSEDRMRTRLGVDISTICARILMGNIALGTVDSTVSTYEEIHWAYSIEFVFCSTATHLESSVFLYLDAHAVDELTRRLSEDSLAPQAEGGGNHIVGLPVRLDCILARAQMPLACVLALQVGEILMVRLLERCEVHIKQQKLFHGAISEDDGALFLTSLDSVNNP